METQHLRLWFSCTKVFGYFRPHPSCRPEFGYLFKQIIMRVEEEGQLPGELVHVQPGVDGGLHLGNAVGEGEADFLRGG